jgi:hypothetical protein
VLVLFEVPSKPVVINISNIRKGSKTVTVNLISVARSNSSYFALFAAACVHVSICVHLLFFIPLFCELFEKSYTGHASPPIGILYVLCI